MEACNRMPCSEAWLIVFPSRPLPLHSFTVWGVKEKKLLRHAVRDSCVGLKGESMYLIPSHWAMASFFISLNASCSCVLFLLLRSASTSSRKITQGAIFWAKENAALMYLTPSPSHLLATAEGWIARKEAPHSAATALASIVFPVPVQGQATGFSRTLTSKQWCHTFWDTYLLPVKCINKTSSAIEMHLTLLLLAHLCL